jgi:hypothetical protein
VRIVKNIKGVAQNLLGPLTKRKIVVFESDDWGSIRMPSKAVYNKLQAKNYQPDKDPYLKYDSLASSEDLQALFDVLSAVKDQHGHPAKITANCIMANPDFKAIRENGFEKYVYEDFTTTLQRYPRHGNAFDCWKEGISQQLFQPQFHGREHINVYQWMKGLQENDQLLHEAFDHQMISISSMPCKLKFGYMEGLDYFSEEEKAVKEQLIDEGLNLFESLFGYPSKSFIANCYVWDTDIEKVLKNHGVRFIQGILKQFMPNLDGDKHQYKFRYHYMGQKNPLQQRYLIRNVFFEPSIYPSVDWLSEALTRISLAFRLGKPAIVGSHRLNYIGYIDENNRNSNLKSFKTLLKEIVKRWPDVEFKSTDQLDEIYAFDA